MPKGRRVSADGQRLAVDRLTDVSLQAMPGACVLLAAFGAGLPWGGGVARWGTA